MVDCVISLLKNQHQGAITALSRHGWLPQPHSPEPLPAATPRLLEARRISPLMHSLREWISTSGLPWRAAIDSLRPQTQSLWQALPMIEKQRFTRHTQSAWEIHRHRIAPQIAAQLQAAITSKQLQIIAGRIQTISADSPFQCQYRKRHETTLLTMESDVIINCTGPNANLEKTKTPLIRQLITDKLATPDPLRLGFAVSPEDQLTTDYPGLYTLGPPTKGAYWEITAVPDIRVQSYNLAKRLLSEQG